MRPMKTQVVLVTLLVATWRVGAGAAVCGNGITEPGEECDDGGICTGTSSTTLTHCVADADCPGGRCKPFSGDGCTAKCARETQPCDSDCNRDGTVTIDEIIRGVDIALGTASVQSCAAMDVNGDGSVMINELLAGVNNALTPWQNAFVDIGGYRLRIHCVGNGSPTVVLDSGLGDDYSVWSHVQPEVANLTRVCSYTRAGLGDGRNASDPGPLPRTSAQMVSELHTLLANSCVPAPYVLAGHSLGGRNVRLYAAGYPDEVAGLVLVDATPEDYFERLQALLPADTWDAYNADLQAFYRAQPTSVQNEWISFPEGAAELRASGPLPPVPLIVLTETRPQPNLDGEAQMKDLALWLELQSALVRLVPDGQQILATQSGHYIQLDQPNLVIDAIDTVVEKVRGDER
jgi:pimeloyl-ACP methyl ester carboxylesterase